MSTKEWVNWSGSVRFAPESVEAPHTEEEVSSLVRRAAGEGLTVRPVGAGHSSTEIMRTEGVLVSLENLRGRESHDAAVPEATLRPGTTVREAGDALLEVDLSMENLGDVDYQTLAGGIGTGTHGTGKGYTNLSGQMVGGRMVIGSGEVVELDRDPELLRAAKVSLGAFGIFTALRLRARRAHRLTRREWCTRIDDCLENLDALVSENRHFDFYWYPRSDEVKLRTWNPPEESPAEIPYATLVKDKTGWSKDVLPNPQELRYEEMEYALPAEAGPECFREVRKRIKEKHRKYVGWRVLYRTIAPDDGYLSPFYDRESVTIAVLQNNTLPYREYFEDIESVFRAYEGRPHWGKKHTLRAGELRPLYPMWDRFLEVRERMDPEGVFMSPYLRRLLIDG